MDSISTESLIQGLGSISIHLAVGVLIVLLVERLVGHRLSPRWRYGLWLFILLRLVIPVTPRIPGGPPDMASHWRGGDSLESQSGTERGRAIPPPVAQGRQRGPVDGPTGASFTPRSSEVLGPQGGEAEGLIHITTSGRSPDGTGLPSESPQESRPRSLRDVGLSTRRLRATPNDAPFASSDNGSASEPIAEGSTHSLVLLGIWLGVAGLLSLRTLARERRFARRVRVDPPITDARISSIFKECVEERGIKVPPTLIASRSIRTPALYGIRSPRLLLPTELAKELEDDELRHIFHHELAHHRHRDVALNGLFQVLRCIYWFHPLLPLALRRTRAAQEIVRDFEVLVTVPRCVPLKYAHTLLKLIERCPSTTPRHRAASMVQRGPTTRRRILMIADFPRRPQRTLLLGLSATSVLAWATFTTAAPQVNSTLRDPQAEGHRELDPGPRGPRVEVSQLRPLPDWYETLASRLETPVEHELARGDLNHILGFLGGLGEINILQTDGVAELEIGRIELDLKHRSIGETLDLLSESQPGLAWGLHDGVVLVGRYGEIPEYRDTRIYDVSWALPPLESDSLQQESKRLQSILRQYVLGDRFWDQHPYAAMRFNKHSLELMLTPQRHGVFQDFLERMRERGSREAEREPSWVASLEEKLRATRVNISSAGAPLESVALQLRIDTGVNLGLPAERAGAPVELQLSDVTLDRALRWLGKPHGLQISIEEGRVHLREEPRTYVRIYDIADLLEFASREAPRSFGEGHILSMLQENARPDCWDQDNVSLETYRGLLIVAQTIQVHREIEQVLDSLRAFVGD